MLNYKLAKICQLHFTHYTIKNDTFYVFIPWYHSGRKESGYFCEKITSKKELYISLGY